MKLFLLAAPYDSGHHKKRMGAGPLLLMNELEASLIRDGYDVRTFEIEINTAFFTEITTSFEVSRNIALQVAGAKEIGEFPIVFSGNCNASAVGTLSGLQDNSGVIWFDCHGDFNTPETTISGYLDGMALAMVTGECWAQLTASIPGFTAVTEKNVIIIGASDLDPLEERRLHASDITMIPANKVKQEIEALANDHLEIQSVYLHIDLDVIDPSYVKVNSYATPGGILPETLFEVISMIGKKFKISGVGFTAYDPSLDPDRKVAAVVNDLAKIIIKSSATF